MPSPELASNASTAHVEPEARGSPVACFTFAAHEARTVRVGRAGSTVATVGGDGGTSATVASAGGKCTASGADLRSVSTNPSAPIATAATPTTISAVGDVRRVGALP